MYDEAYLELTQSTKKQNSILWLNTRTIVGVVELWLLSLKSFKAFTFQLKYSESSSKSSTVWIYKL